MGCPLPSPPPWLLLTCACLAAAGTTRAQSPPPLERNDFKLDLFHGPVLGPGRVVAMGGAFTALATGIDGAPWNPSSYASRPLWELDWFEWDVTLGFIPGALANADFDNNGRFGFDYEDFSFFDAGLRLQFGQVGIGALLLFQDYVVNAAATESTHVQLITGHYGGGYAFFDGQLVLGVGARTASIEIRQGGNALVSFVGTGPEAGVLIRPVDLPWRIGVAGRLPVSSRVVGGLDAEGVQRAGGLVLPNEVRMPWELQVGAALQLGERPLNRRWVDPTRLASERRRDLEKRWAERERNQVREELIAQHGGENISEHRLWEREPQDPAWWGREQRRRQEEEAGLEHELEDMAELRNLQVESLPRHYVLLSTEVIVTGKTPSGVGMESFLSGVREASGRDISIGFRAGIEAEPWPHRLKTRLGGYVEPSRFTDRPYRVHVTGGLDLRLFRWDFFGLFAPFDVRVGVSADGAAQYSNIGFSIGFWH